MSHVCFVLKMSRFIIFLFDCVVARPGNGPYKLMGRKGLQTRGLTNLSFFGFSTD